MSEDEIDNIVLGDRRFKGMEAALDIERERTRIAVEALREIANNKLPEPEEFDNWSQDEQRELGYIEGLNEQAELARDVLKELGEV